MRVSKQASNYAQAPGDKVVSSYKNDEFKMLNAKKLADSIWNAT